MLPLSRPPMNLPRSRVSARKALLPAFAVAPVRAGCSFEQRRFHPLDHLGARRFDDHRPMYSAQRVRVEPAVMQRVDWRWAARLPSYLVWLRADLDVTRANAHLTEALGFAHDISRRAAREGGRRMVGVAPAQIEALDKRMNKGNRDCVEDCVGPPRDEHVRERARRMTKRTDAWLGALAPARRTLIDDGADMRARRHAGGESLFVSPGTLFTPGCTAARDANLVCTAEALSASLTPAHRGHRPRAGVSRVADIDPIACHRPESSLQARS